MATQVERIKWVEVRGLVDLDPLEGGMMVLLCVSRVLGGGGESSYWYIVVDRRPRPRHRPHHAFTRVHMHACMSTNQ